MVDLGPTEPLDPQDPRLAGQPPLEGVEQYVARLEGAYSWDNRPAIIGPVPEAMGVAMRDVVAERHNQDHKWGEQNHRDGTGGEMLPAIAAASREICQHASAMGNVTWKMILQEEVSEAFAETDTAKLRAELVQVAATAAAWVEAIDRRTGVAAYCEKADAHRMAHIPVVPPAPHDVPGSE